MKIRIVIAVTLAVVASVALADERKFTASSIPSAGLKKPGRVLITNNGTSITAWRFFGNIKEALVSLRSVRGLNYTPYGPAVFDSRARLDSPMPAHLAALFIEASQTHGVDPRLLAAISRRESAWNPNATSRVGACGLMQLMPDTARFLGVSNIYDARENVFGGARYLRTLLDTFHGDLDLTLAAYNAGPGAVQRYKGVPPYRETRAYVAAVRANYERALRN